MQTFLTYLPYIVVLCAAGGFCLACEMKASDVAFVCAIVFLVAGLRIVYTWVNPEPNVRIGDTYIVQPTQDLDLSSLRVTVVATDKVCAQSRGDVVSLDLRHGFTALHVLGIATKDQGRVMVDVVSQTMPCVRQALVAPAAINDYVELSDEQHPTEVHDTAFDDELTSVKPPAKH